MKVKLAFIPFPANIEVLPEETTFLVIDADNCYHIASRVGDEIEVIQEDFEGAPEEIDIRFIAVLPEPEFLE
jgi:hypothetical protein